VSQFSPWSDRRVVRIGSRSRLWTLTSKSIGAVRVRKSAEEHAKDEGKIKALIPLRGI
jgi:hypothetical protein